MKYSINELNTIAGAIKSVIERSAEEKYSRSLIYGLNKNLRKIQSELEVVQEQMEELPESLNEYKQKMFESAIEKGGEPVSTVDGGQSVNMEVEGFDKEGFEEEVERLANEYGDLINEAEGIMEKNNKLRQDKIADIEWYPISLNHFPETASAQDIPFQLTDLIVE